MEKEKYVFQNCPPKGISRAGNSEGNHSEWSRFLNSRLLSKGAISRWGISLPRDIKSAHPKYFMFFEAAEHKTKKIHLNRLFMVNFQTRSFCYDDDEKKDRRHCAIYKNIYIKSDRYHF